MNSNTVGWFYVGGGRLRYRDEDGWTDHFIDAESVRGHDWPPPAPMAFGQARADDIDMAEPLASARGGGLRIRRPRLARGRRRGR